MAVPSARPLAAPFDFELPPAPYPGLRPFEPEEWPIFFGREELPDEVINRLIDQHLVVVHGDSGCGKRSLVRAGVLAQLEQERARSGAQWRTCHMLPREAPLRNLVMALAELDGAGADPDRVHQIHRALNHGRDAPDALAELLLRDADDNLCILVDQFEELFSFAKEHGRDEAQLFVDILVGLQEKPPPGLYAILTMRSEFLGVCARFKGLAVAVNRTQYLLPQMERAALMCAIREPATLYDGEVSGELAERLIADAGDGQDQLPLIQHGLMLLWWRKVGTPTDLHGLAKATVSFRHESGLEDAVAPLHLGGRDFSHHRGPAWRLGLEDYRGGRGLAVLLSAHADEVMANAASDIDERRIVQRLFRGLMDVNAEGQRICRPRTLCELVEVTGSDEPTLRAIIDHFRAEGVSFLRPYGNAPIEPGTLIDISHEALIRCWQKLVAVRRQMKEDDYDVFIAYAREDKTKADELAMQLRMRGFSVFWDAKVPPGQTWRAYISQALVKSKCVVAAWSIHSVNSDWVLEEAEVGKRARKLVPVRFDDADPPFGFQFIQAADLSVWPSDVESDPFQDFLGEITGLVRPGMS